MVWQGQVFSAVVRARRYKLYDIRIETRLRRKKRRRRRVRPASQEEEA